MCPASTSLPIDITLITYSYSPKSFEKLEQTPLYTSFIFNDEKSVRHALAYWINVGAGNYGDIDLLFHKGVSQSHWSTLSNQEVREMEVDLRQRKVEIVVQIVESLEEMWRIGRFPPSNEILWEVSTAYDSWNALSEEIWKLHLMKHKHKKIPSSTDSDQSSESVRSRPEKTPSQKDLEDFDGTSDAYISKPSMCALGNLDGSETLPEARPREDSVPIPDLSTQEAVCGALDYWTEKNKNHSFYDLDYLSYFCSEEFEGDSTGGFNYVQGFGIRKSVAGWEIVLGLKQVLFEGVFPPKKKAAELVHKTFKKWNQCSREVQAKIDEELAKLGPLAPSQTSSSKLSIASGQNDV